MCIPQKISHYRSMKIAYTIYEYMVIKKTDYD